MDDNDIIGLFLARDEGAIEAASREYGAYCAAIAHGILGDQGAAEECVNDTWLKCWQSIPPQQPRSLKGYAGRIARNLALSALRGLTAQKRGGGQVELALDELSECVSGGDTPEGALDRQAFRAALDGFLAELPERNRSLFLRRYWYLDSTQQLARRFRMSQTQVTTTLHRLRQKLRAHLEQEGFKV
ncbi:MAG: sigma-70 family RNA polymerase sigma factor [Oscillospiraceae bacterium]|nr:sigma-70 family RNA polymerase sigma factor [Oscillospiraceae bacterium]